MTFSPRVYCAFAILLTTLLSGCVGSQDANIKKDASYNKRLDDTVIVWASSNSFPMELYRTRMPSVSSPNSPPFITEQDKIEARKGISELMALFSRHAVNAMSKALTDAQVHIHPREATTTTKLLISPVGSISGCTGSGCEHTLKVQVALYDSAAGKDVWSGTFKVAAPYMAKGDEALVKDFADAVVVELKRSNLL